MLEVTPPIYAGNEPLPTPLRLTPIAAPFGLAEAGLRTRLKRVSAGQGGDGGGSAAQEAETFFAKKVPPGAETEGFLAKKPSSANCSGLLSRDGAPTENFFLAKKKLIRPTVSAVPLRLRDDRKGFLVKNAFVIAPSGARRRPRLPEQLPDPHLEPTLRTLRTRPRSAIACAQ